MHETDAVAIGGRQSHEFFVIDSLSSKPSLGKLWTTPNRSG
jgi:hypothetical protein